jgi:hypothetical protein
MKRIWSKIAMAAALVGTLLALGGAPQPADARIRPCPLFLFKACVLTPSGARMTVATNACFARLRHWTILHRGPCIGGTVCPFIWAPVCAINPFTHMKQTYPNLCIAEHDNAVWVHNGPCP